MVLRHQTAEMVKATSSFHVKEGDSKFGIVEVDAGDARASADSHHLVLAIDRSGSMAVKEIDHMTKMEHVQHTLRNMMNYLAEVPMTVFVSVVVFDDEIETVIMRERVTKTSASSIISKCDTISPRNRTDISGALKEMERIRSTEDGSQVTCILLTDGQPTAGVTDDDGLAALVPSECTCAFMSYGVDHNAILMSRLASGPLASNYFVDSAENAGSVYGEILHGVLFEAARDVKITVKGAKLYDWRSNSWGTTLCVPRLGGGTTKVFHLLSKEGPSGDGQWEVVRTPPLLTATWHSGGEDQKLELDLSGAYAEENARDLSNYKLRQEVQEVMARAEGKGVVTSDEIQDLRSRLKTRIESNPEDSAFVTNLLDDLFITERSFMTMHGSIFLMARRSSQGDQRAYNIRNINALGGGTGGPLPLRRSDTAVPDHKVSQADHSPYAGKEQLELMRQCSAPF